MQKKIWKGMAVYEETIKFFLEVKLIEEGALDK